MLIYMSELVFNVTQEDDGGYSAEAVGELIFTQGDTWKELCSNVQEALQAHFYEDLKKKPQKVHLHLVHDEELLVA